MREPSLGAVIGRKGVGKSFTTLKLIESCLRGDMTKGAAPRRVLILDVNDEYSQYRAIDLKHVATFCDPRYKVECRRVRIFKKQGNGSVRMSLDEIADALFQILESFRGGLLLIEDISLYISDSLPNDLIGKIATQRHVDCDIILHFQTIGKIGHPKIVGNLDWVRMHRISGSVEREKNKFPDKVQMLMIAEMMVNRRYNNGDTRHYVYIDWKNEKIKGKFDKNEFNEAVDEYIGENYNAVMKPMLNKRDLGGKLMYDYPKAVEHLRNNLFKQYYGN